MMEAFFRRVMTAGEQVSLNMAEIRRLEDLLREIEGQEAEELRKEAESLRREVVAEATELMRMQQDAFRILRLIPEPSERQVLQAFYVDRRSIMRIASDMGCSRRWVQMLKRRGIEAADRIPEKLRPASVTFAGGSVV